MANFDEAYKIVRDHEGGYAHDPDDRGGETYKGIARKSFPKWLGWRIVDQVKATQRKGELLDDLLGSEAELQQMVTDFYKKEFWDILNLDNIDHQSIAAELFDIGVHMGTGVAAAFLQKGLNVLNRSAQDYADLPITANIGPLTTKTANAHQRSDELLKVLNCLQGARYIDICLRDPKQEKFLRGWLSRVSF